MHAQRIVVMLLLFLSAAAVASVPAYAGYPYVGLYGGVYDLDYVEGPGGSDHSSCGVFGPAPYTDIEMWIWWLPDPQKGLTSVEFKIVYPTSTYIIQGPVTPNPLILAELGSLPVGIASTVGALQCQYDWFWSHHQTITLKKTTPSGFISIVADPALSVPPFAVLVSDCNFYNYACTKLGDLALNQSCLMCLTSTSEPRLDSVIVESASKIHAHFDYTGSEECTGIPYKNHFIIYDNFSPADTVAVLDAVR